MSGKRHVLLVLITLLSPVAVLAGSQTFSTPGTHTFTVPQYTGSLTVEVWGGGGGGEHCYPQANGVRYVTYTRFCWGGNTAGSASSFNGVIANGGQTGDGAVGGTATGGDVNLSGENSSSCGGSVYQYCGGGGSGLDPVATRHGVAPGGGADGYFQASLTYGGGGGGYAKKTWNPGALTTGASYTVTVGSGGSNANGNGAAPGAPGRVTLTWGDAPAGTCPAHSSGTFPDCVCDAGYTGNGQTGANLVCTPNSVSLSCNISLVQNPITEGQATTLAWSSAGGATAFFINNMGWVGASGSTSVGPSQTTNYSGTAYKCPDGTSLSADASHCVSTEAAASSGSQTFSATGGVQYFTVPAGVTAINVTLKGAGGGSGCFYQSSPGSLGGSGGRTQGTLAVTPGQTLTVMVGGAGSVGNCTAAGDPARVSGGYGGGGKSQNGGSGGGRSAIFSSSNTELMTAGGGGGGGNSGIVNGHWWCTTGNKGPDDCPGGNGGGTTGADGVSPSTKLGNYTYTGHGGTQTAAGVCPSDGSISASGHNGGNTYFSAGGGGGGWYGGSGSCDYGVGGGGGGSGHCDSSSTSCSMTQGGGSLSDTDGTVIISWTGGAGGSTSVTPETAMCAAILTVNCAPGSHWDPMVNQCVADAQQCLPGQHWDAAQNMCVDDSQCPAGQHWNGTQCVADNCPAGQHWDVAAGACVPDNCPAGQHWNGSQCVADNCPAGQHWDVAAGACVPDNCPAGQHWNGSQCVADNCPAGQHWNGSQCVADNCPA
ncbi:hypothetical protein FJY94_01255, partial [Candidatus Kaiserbacteria bacterium]|nr:hypothetical protein [Candidatus Kaiserbacteria bacterium]